MPGYARITAMTTGEVEGPFDHILNKALNNRMVDPSIIFVNGTYQSFGEQEEFSKGNGGKERTDKVDTLRATEKLRATTRSFSITMKGLKRKV